MALKAFGEGELAFSNGEDVIDLRCVEGAFLSDLSISLYDTFFAAEFYIHNFDDMDAFRLPIEKNWWFSRTNLSLTSDKGVIEVYISTTLLLII